MTDVTVFNLLYFMPLNEREKEIFNFDKNIVNQLKSKLDKNMFYLGGQVKMKHNDFINLHSIQLVREINKKKEIEYGEPYNSIELYSINNEKNLLDFVENMIVKYNEVMKLREKEKHFSD